MTRLPARGFGQAANHLASPPPKRKPMANVPPMGGAPPAGPRKAGANTVRLAPVGTKLAPKLMNSTNPPHRDRTRAVGVALGGPSITNPGGMQGYPSAPSA